MVGVSGLGVVSPRGDLFVGEFGLELSRERVSVESVALNFLVDDRILGVADERGKRWKSSTGPDAAEWGRFGVNGVGRTSLLAEGFPGTDMLSIVSLEK